MRPDASAEPVTAAPPDQPAALPAPAAVLGWCCFLANSWTWCIGLFLPALLLRDFGPWSFAAFAIPNVVGAAAMGVALTPSASRALLARHSAACEAFSLLTRSFQYFFVIWLLLGINSRALGLIVLGALLAGALLGTRPYTGIARVLANAVLLFAISAGLLAIATIRGALQPPPPIAPALPPTDLIWAAPVIIFGFLLCPWLDLSFHHARQSASGRPGTLAFLLGFGLLFAALITGTFFYAHLFLDPRGLFASDLLRTASASVILAHIGAQLGYTSELHRAQTVRDNGGARVTHSDSLGWGGIGIAAGVAGHFLPPIAGLSGGEVIYRCFLAFYGLVFPAYVWLCMIPTRDGHSGPNPTKLAAWAAAVLIASPMFWMGFIQRHTIWLAPGLGVVLIARLAVILSRRPEWRAP